MTNGIQDETNKHTKTNKTKKKTFPLKRQAYIKMRNVHNMWRQYLNSKITLFHFLIIMFTISSKSFVDEILKIILK